MEKVVNLAEAGWWQDEMVVWAGGSHSVGYVEMALKEGKTEQRWVQRTEAVAVVRCQGCSQPCVSECRRQVTLR